MLIMHFYRTHRVTSYFHYTDKRINEKANDATCLFFDIFFCSRMILKILKSIKAASEDDSPLAVTVRIQAFKQGSSYTGNSCFLLPGLFADLDNFQDPQSFKNQCQ